MMMMMLWLYDTSRMHRLGNQWMQAWIKTHWVVAQC